MIVEIRSGRSVVAEGPTPCLADGIMEGTYKVTVTDPRFEPVETTVTLAPGAMEDVSVVTTPRSKGFGATIKRRMGTLVAAAVLVALIAGAVVLRPWGRTLDLSELRARVQDGSVTDARLTAEGIEGRLAVGPFPAPFRVAVDEGEGPAVVEELRSAGLAVDTSWEVARLIRRAMEAQSRTRYFGHPGEDVRSFAERALALEPENAEARSLLLKVAERMAWDAEAALEEGSPDEAEALVQECLSVAPEHSRCTEAAGES